MGTACKITEIKPTKMAATERNTFKNILKKPLEFFKRKNNNKTNKTDDQKAAAIKTVNENNDIDLLNDNLENLHLNKATVLNNKATVLNNKAKGVNNKAKELNNKATEDRKAINIEEQSDDDDNDEFKNFTFKIIKDEDYDVRKHSASEDSGFSDKDVFSNNIDNDITKTYHKIDDDKLSDTGNDDDDELVAQFEVLTVEQDDKDKKKLRTVYLSRGPIRNRDVDRSFGSIHPYHQIHQINHQTLTGSQVYVNNKELPYVVQPHIKHAHSYNDIYKHSDNRPTPIYGVFEMDLALSKIQNNIDNFPRNPQEGQIYWQTAQEFLRETSDSNVEDSSNILSDFKELQTASVYPVVTGTDFTKAAEVVNPIEEFANADNILVYNNDLDFHQFDDINVLLTPPRSNENNHSPASFNSPSPGYYSNMNLSTNSGSDSILSPVMSSPNLSKTDEYEKYQDLSGFEEASIPKSVIDTSENHMFLDKKIIKEKSKYTMKQFKDIQNELISGFSRRECCKTKRECVKKIFKDIFDKLTDEEKRNLCVKVGGLDLKTCCGVLHHIMLSLSSGSDKEVLETALFGVVCERMLAEKPEIFIEKEGLNLLKASALRCANKPVLTRYLVHCTRIALNTDEGKKISRSEPVFDEVDINGDTLLSVLASRGDECSEVLAELFANDGESNAHALFDIHHCNNEGYTALHTACIGHGDATHCLHAVHVLLTHGHADLWKGDMKGGDSAVHHAVRSSTCDLPLVMCLFKHVHRTEWKRLAHHTNRSSATPLDLARIATKSANRQKYPTEILDFLKKCR